MIQNGRKSKRGEQRAEIQVSPTNPSGSPSFVSSIVDVFMVNNWFGPAFKDLAYFFFLGTIHASLHAVTPALSRFGLTTRLGILASHPSKRKRHRLILRLQSRVLSDGLARGFISFLILWTNSV